jgi:CMP/dCMP kinase
MTPKQAPKISITGDLGSGKSSVARILAAQLGARIISTGSIQRAIASQLGLTTLELNKKSESEPEFDNLIDNQIKAMADLNEALIFDSRLAWHFLPNTLKICLTVPLQVAAKRVLSDDGRSGESYQSVDEAAKALRQRRESELLRFQTLYGVDCDNPANFDLVIDSSNHRPEEIANMILARLGD